jgi:hypothetical protein
MVIFTCYLYLTSVILLFTQLLYILGTRIHSWFLIRDGLGLFFLKKMVASTCTAYGRFAVGLVGSWQNRKNPITKSLPIKYLDINHRTK